MPPTTKKNKIKTHSAVLQLADIYDIETSKQIGKGYIYYDFQMQPLTEGVNDKGEIIPPGFYDFRIVGDLIPVVIAAGVH